MGVFAEVDFYVFGHAFGHGHAGGFGICAGLIDFGHGGAVGFFTGGFGCAADALDAFSFAGFVFDFYSVVPFFPRLWQYMGAAPFCSAESEGLMTRRHTGPFYIRI